jgi:hypothetical protein
MTAQDDFEALSEAWAELKRTVREEVEANLPGIAFLYLALVAIAIVVKVML